MVLLSVATKSLFSNVIAYEASNIIDGKTEIMSLQYLAAPFPPWWQDPATPITLESYNFSITQRADFSSQFLSMLMHLSFSLGADKLEDKYYIGINTTTVSLNALPSPVGSLSEVPGYCLSIDCRANTLTALGIIPDSLKDNMILTWFLEDNPANPKNTATSYTASFIRGKQVGVDDNIILPFVGFSPDLDIQERLYLGFLSALSPSGSEKNTGEASSYGKLKYLVTNQTLNTLTTIKLFRKFSLFGAYLVRLPVRLAFTNWKKQKPALGNELRMQADMKKGQIFLSCAYRNGPGIFDIGYLYKTLPGIGSVFTNTAYNCWPLCEGDDASLNYEKVALNALYAIGETDCMFNKISMQNVGQNETFQVSSGILEQRYHITYVPLILFGGLLSCLCACLITFGRLVYHWRKRSRSFEMWRKVNVKRLLADVVDGLWNENDFYGISGRDNTALREWSEDYNVCYVECTDESGTTIKLEKLTSSAAAICI